jgi:hypothetical protein
MQCIAIDTIGPMTSSAGNPLALTIVDYYTRYGAAIPLRRQTTANIVVALMDRWFSVHGFPKLIICDNGSGFKSKTMREVARLLGIQIHFVSPYHPQSNGLCERLNATIINMLASYARDKQNQWVHFIQMVAFAYNTSKHSATGFTPYFLAHGREASIGSDAALSLNTDVRNLPDYVREMQRDLAFAHQHIMDRVTQASDEREKLNDSLKSLAVFEPGAQVYVYAPPKSADGNSGKLMSPYHGPYTVLRQTGRVTYSLRNNHTHKKISAHVTLMKPAIQRPAHLVPAAAAAASAPAPAPDMEPVVAAQVPQGVARHTRAQRSTRLQQQEQGTASAQAAGVPNGSNLSPAAFSAQQPAAVDNEQKHSPVPQTSTLSPIDPDAETSADDDTDDEDGNDDSSPPDEALEEGEVPPEIVQQLLPTAQRM